MDITRFKMVLTMAALLCAVSVSTYAADRTRLQDRTCTPTQQQDQTQSRDVTCDRDQDGLCDRCGTPDANGDGICDGGCGSQSRTGR